MKYMFLPLRRYADFRGRSRRMEYWMFLLFQWIVGIVFMILFFALFASVLMDLSREYGSSSSYSSSSDYGYSYETSYQANIPPEEFIKRVGPLGIVMTVLYWLFALAMLIPTLAVTVRRLHDTNRTGWWILAPLTPYLLIIFLTVIAAVVPESAVVLVPLMLLLLLAVFVLGIVLLVFMFLDGTRGPNRFGPDPKMPDVGRTFA